MVFTADENENEKFEKGLENVNLFITPLRGDDSSEVMTKVNIKL